jgi:hypothetical protein
MWRGSGGTSGSVTESNTAGGDNPNLCLVLTMTDDPPGTARQGGSTPRFYAITSPAGSSPFTFLVTGPPAMVEAMERRCKRQACRGADPAGALQRLNAPDFARR